MLPPVGLLVGKVRGHAGSGQLRTPFPAGSPRRDAPPSVRSSSGSAASPLRVVGSIPDTGGPCWFCAAAVNTGRADYAATADPTLLRNAVSLSDHPAKTCPTLRRAILYVARTILRVPKPTGSRPSGFSMVEVDDLPATSDHNGLNASVLPSEDDEEYEQDF